MKGDFTPKYRTEKDIIEDKSLTHDQILREKVKHHAMCLFALACDLSEQNRLYNEAIAEHDKLVEIVRKLKSQNDIFRALLRDAGINYDKYKTVTAKKEIEKDAHQKRGNNAFMALLQKKNMTLKEFATGLKVCETTARKWSEGCNMPNMENMFVMSKLLDVSIDELQRIFKIGDNNGK